MVRANYVEQLRDELLTAHELYKATMEAYNRGETTENAVNRARQDWQEAKRDLAAATPRD